MSAPAIPSHGLRRLALAAALSTLLFFVYLLTFSGQPLSDDERYIIDTVDSLATRGSLLLNQTSYLRPVQTSDVEPGQPLLSIPLYWLAYHTPWVGNVHTLFLFSPIVTALTGALLFYTALDFGYRERTAIAAVLLFGLTTIVWPYTKTYFREPLTMLNLFAAAFLLNRWRTVFRAGTGQHWAYLGGGVVVTMLALLSKEAAIIALPALMLLAYPGGALDGQRGRRIVQIAAWLVVVGLIVGVALFVFRTDLLAWTYRYDVVRRLSGMLANLPHVWLGIGGYLISPGKAVWWTSPVLLLALGAPFVLPRARWRESWLPLGLLLIFVVTYALVRGEQWSGGTGWGARYMAPLTPFLMIAALPLIDRMLNSGAWLPRLALGALALWGLAVQIGGTYVYLLDYYDYLSRAITDTPWRGPAVWTFRWSQPIGALLYLPQAETDIRWLIPRPDWPTLAVLAAALVLTGGLIGWLHRSNVTRRQVLVGALGGAPLLALAVAIFALRQAYDDPRIHGNDPVVHEMREYLTEHAAPGDTILLSSPTYVPHFMNYYKGRTTWYSLPWAPGERYSPEQPPAVAEGTLEELAGKRAVDAQVLFSQTGTSYNGQPIWLVMDLGPDLPWAPRPVEHYFAEHNYIIRTVDFNQYARLVQLLPYQAPLTTQPPAITSGARFGEAIRLVGFDVTVNAEPHGLDAVQPGDQLGISLLWEADAPVGESYTVAVHLLGPDGLPIMQHDRAPVGGFAPTNTWQPGQPLRDNYGFILPPDLPPGEYQVWVILYSWPSLERLPVTGADGESLGDHLALGGFKVR